MVLWMLSEGPLSISKFFVQGSKFPWKGLTWRRRSLMGRLLLIARQWKIKNCKAWTKEDLKMLISQRKPKIIVACLWNKETCFYDAFVRGFTLFWNKCVRWTCKVRTPTPKSLFEEWRWISQTLNMIMYLIIIIL